MLDKKYNFKETEKKWQNYWENEKIYCFDPSSDKETFSIDTPPPTISGALHIGHIFSYTQAEIIARYQRMQGKNVFYPFGFDDNGLPTERLVEKEEGILAKTLPRDEFIQKCLSTTYKYEAQFKELWQALGFSVDWSLEYETINPLSQKLSQRSFIELAKSGKAYQKEMPVLWCTCCQTSIAQAELEFSEKETTFIYIPFIVDDKELIIATTRPELLYGCTALFINPKDERFNNYIGKNAIVPLYNFTIPILGDTKVNPEKGSGIVMCATFGDTTDLEWYKEYNLPYKKVINIDGTIDKDVPYIGGITIINARKEIIALLDEKGLIIKSEKITHSVAVHERCGKEIEIIMSKQWYIDILSEKDRFFKAADKINWYPAYMKDKYLIWVENLKWDWCISRQRYFGVPLPVWYCKNCGATIFPDEENLPINPLSSAPKHACSCGSHDYIAESAVLDTWATSSLSPLINAKWGCTDEIKSIYPMSLRTQAHEIIRTWAFYTIVKSLYHTNRLPWKDIMISGYVLAKKGEKISKSKGNASITPEALVEKYSADSIRYWSAASKLGTDTMFCENDLQPSNRFLNKLFNAAKFTTMHLIDYKNETVTNLTPIDRWILERLKQTTKKTSDLLNKYEVGDARHEIDDFFWNDFCDNYLEIVKDRLYKPEKHGYENRLSAQYALYHSFLGILKLYAIYAPHITEEIYQDYFIKFEKINSIHRLTWDQQNDLDEIILSLGETAVKIVAEARKLKSERNLSLKEPLDKIVVKSPEYLIDMLKLNIFDLLACTGANELELIEDDVFSLSVFLDETNIIEI